MTHSYSYSYLFKDNLKYLCVTEGLSMYKAFDYLYEIQMEFEDKYSEFQIENALQYNMLEFNSIINRIAKKYEDRIEEKSMMKNKNELNSVYQSTIDKLVNIEEIKKTMTLRNQVFNRREFRLSVSILYIDLALYFIGQVYQKGSAYSSN